MQDNRTTRGGFVHLIDADKPIRIKPATLNTKEFLNPTFCTYGPPGEQEPPTHLGNLPLSIICVTSIESILKMSSRRKNFCDQQGIGECPNKQCLAKWIARGIACYNWVAKNLNHFLKLQSQFSSIQTSQAVHLYTQMPK